MITGDAGKLIDEALLLDVIRDQITHRSTQSNIGLLRMCCYFLCVRKELVGYVQLYFFALHIYNKGPMTTKLHGEGQDPARCRGGPSTIHPHPRNPE